jgi:microcystin-dependent protein
MSSPYIGELRIFPFGFAPRGWALCNGQLMSIQQNTALFSILGTHYGGNGVNTFGLPNLQGNVPIGVGNGYGLGQVGGEANHTLFVTEMPSHSHSANGVAALANIAAPANANLAEPVAHEPNNVSVNVNAYCTGGALSAMGPGTIAMAGNSVPHNNMSPYLVINVCIALFGIFPSRN